MNKEIQEHDLDCLTFCADQQNSCSVKLSLTPFETFYMTTADVRELRDWLTEVLGETTYPAPTSTDD